jgi:integrase
MASISRGPNGRRLIQFVAPDGRRKTLRLGKVSQRIAEEVRVKVEALAAAGQSGFALDRDTADWLGRCGAALLDKLAAVGLVPRREGQAARLGEFLDGYIARRTDLDPATVRNLKIGAKRLTNFFGRERELRTISAGDCDEWVVWMKGQYAEATVGKSVKWGKQFFRAAARKKFIPENPFEDVKGPGEKNEARMRFINRDTTGQVLEACPSLEWRLIFALSRYGGLRCPSEHMALEWADVDWGKGRFLVRSPKTGNRWVPLFPELRPYLEEAFEAAPEGATHVVHRYLNPAKDLRSQLLRILRRAGLEPWPRLFHNLRASRETELAAEFPLHVVCAWIGNTERIAARHYLQVTDGDFERAATGAAKAGAGPPEPALQKPVQQPTAPPRSDPQAGHKSRDDCGLLREGAGEFSDMRDAQLTPTGFEPVSRP